MSGAAASAVRIERLDVASFEAAFGGLVGIVVDAVASGASVGFVDPFDATDAASWWRGLAPALADGSMVLLVARRGDGRVVGTVQLHPSPKANQWYRADVAKLLVHRDARGQGIATTLMAAIEAEAVATGRTLLVLDTAEGSTSDRLYRRLGWIPFGIVPEYASYPDRSPCDVVFFWKKLGPIATA
ncbi:MAG: GNAT family N-acetyltransferase [Siculibacillus sp.]